MIEIAPGVDLERDVLAHMAFRPDVSAHLKTMDPRLFAPAPMALKAEVDARPPRYRSARLQAWMERQESRLNNIISDRSRLYFMLGHPVRRFSTPCWRPQASMPWWWH
ncbi:hypothetical protein [Sodalis glossinidius]|uniref:hypothetical protein n=1 Tax=Sodalis glossinidius TaxID=63612 RepID=UPI0002F42DBA|nr:hypothetical protein [Sodalis glossinidius]